MVFQLKDISCTGEPPDWIFYIYLSERRMRERPHSAIAFGHLKGKDREGALSSFNAWRSRKPWYRNAVEVD